MSPRISKGHYREHVMRIDVDRATIDPLRAAVAEIQRQHGVHATTLQAELRLAIAAHVERLSGQHHEGRPFPPTSGDLARGRRARPPVPGMPPAGEPA